MLVFLDLPGDLVREMKRKAAQERRRLSELAEECMRRGFTPGVPPTDEVPLFPHDTDAPADGEMTLGEALDRARIH